MTATLREVTPADVTAFENLMRSVHPEHFAAAGPAPKRPGPVKVEPGHDVGETIRNVFSAPAPVDIGGGRTVAIREPKVKEIRAVIGRVAGAATAMASGRVTNDNVGSLLPPFQALMLDCLVFEGEEPANRGEWFDDLPASVGLRLVEAFAASVAFDALMAQCQGILGKLAPAVQAAALAGANSPRRGTASGG